MEYCKDTCKNQLPQPCQRQGYQDPNNCYQCKCPDGFAGTYCEMLQPAKGALCGRTETLTSGYTHVFSPGYNSVNGHYNERIECNWLIKAPRGQKIAFQFEGDFSVYCHKEGHDNLCHHWVEVRFKKDLTLTGARFCCDKRPTVVLTSEGEEMLILMRANFSTPNTHRGFKAKVYPVTDTGSSVPSSTARIWTTRTTQRPWTPRPVITTTTQRSWTRRPVTTTTQRSWTRRPVVTTRRTTVRTTTRVAPPGPTLPSAGPSINRPIKPIKDSLDVAFLLDSSGSIGRTNWFKMLKFVKQMAFFLGLASGHTRIGVISYGNKGTLSIKLASHVDLQSFNSAVDELKWKDQYTNTPSALAVMRSELFTPRNGDRDDVPNIGIIITDGAANKDADMLREEARLARNGGHTLLFGIAVGDKADKAELAAITNSQSHVISCLDFDWLTSRLQITEITNRIKAAVWKYKPTTTTTNPNLAGGSSKQPVSGVTRPMENSSVYVFIMLSAYCIFAQYS